jgi:hypothetical protein
MDIFGIQSSPGPYARVFDVFRKMESRFRPKPAGFASFEQEQV